MRRRNLFSSILATTYVVCGLTAGSQAAEPRRTNLAELVVLPPKGHERGLPPVKISGGEVALPPTVHIHRYYYSGNREFQGPLLSGGNTIVVANHPTTGKRTYIEVMLPDGAPVIAYDKSSITYVYPKQRVRLGFSRLFPSSVKVAYLPGRGIHRNLRTVSRAALSAVKRYDATSPTNRSVKNAVRGAVDVGKGAFAVVDGARAFVFDKVMQTAQALPGVQTLRSLGRQSAERGKVERLRQAGLRRVETERQRAFSRTSR